MKKFLALMLTLCLLLGTVGVAYAVALPEKIWFVYDEITVQVGEVFELGLETYPENSGDHFSYTFSKKNVVKLTEHYDFQAVGAGTTTVSVKGKFSGLKDNFKVTVVDPNAVSKVVLDQEGTTVLNMGETLQLNAALQPETAKSTLKWSTSSKKIAKVDGNGVVTPVKEGTATITVKAANGKKDTVKVKVVDPYKPSKVVLDQSGTVVLGMGETLQLNTALQPETAKTTLKWSTSSKKIATVDGNGVVTPVKEGTATITVKTANGKKDSVKVKVVDPYKPSKVVLDVSGTVMLSMGETLELNAALQPETAQTTLKWSISSKKIAKVDGNGVVTPVKEGTATITVKTANGKKDSVKVKVVDPYKPAKVTLDKSGSIALAKGETVQLSAAVEPATAKTTLTWKSSNPKVATVDENGLVTCLKSGSVTISVVTGNGVKDTVKVKGVGAVLPKPGIGNDLLGFIGRPIEELEEFVGKFKYEYDAGNIGFQLPGEISGAVSDDNDGGWDAGIIRCIVLDDWNKHAGTYTRKYTLDGLSAVAYDHYEEFNAAALSKGWKRGYSYWEDGQGGVTYSKTVYDRENGNKIKLTMTTGFTGSGSFSGSVTSSGVGVYAQLLK